jgi:hypothetical protein
MADLTRFDFHVYRFLGSDTVDRMTAEEVGQYILLLCRAWQRGKDTMLPDDLDYLARHARCKEVSPLVLSKFPIIHTPEGNQRRNDTLYGEWLLTLERSQSARERGAKGLESRYGTGYSESNSECSSDQNNLAHTVPYQSNHTNQSNQTIPVQFRGGSFGQGDFKNISVRWRTIFKKPLSRTNQNQEQYSLACQTYNEDVVLKYLEDWAQDNQWIAAHPKGGNRLYRFFQDLPAMIEGDNLALERNKHVEKKEIKTRDDLVYEIPENPLTPQEQKEKMYQI